MWLRYQVEGYTEDIVHDLEHRLDMIFGRQVNRVHVLDFARLTGEMRQALTNRMGMVYTGDVGQELFTSHAWRRLFEIRGSLVWEFMLEFFSTCRMSYTELREFILALGLHSAEEMAEDGFKAYWDILGLAPSYTYIKDPMRRLCHRLISCNISGRVQAPEK
ncbi:hypothetical protein Tco_1230670, partial [Tanacetum coccineum]